MCLDTVDNVYCTKDNVYCTIDNIYYTIDNVYCIIGLQLAISDCKRLNGRVLLITLLQSPIAQALSSGIGHLLDIFYRSVSKLNANVRVDVCVCVRACVYEKSNRIVNLFSEIE